MIEPGGTPELPPARAADQLTIDGRAVRARQRLHAYATLLLPLAGTLLALMEAVTHGLGRLEAALLVGMYAVTMMGVDTGYHRLFSHRAFKAHPALRALLAVCGSMAAQGPVIYWAANHRLHHSRSDTEEDLHSPRVDEEGQHRGGLSGLWHAHVGWMFGHAPANPLRLGKDLLKDLTLGRINELYYLWVLLGLLLPAALGGAFTGTWAGAGAGLLWGGLVRMFLVQHATFAGNSLCHLFGRQPHRTRDGSTDNLWLTLPTFGGALHNTHHAFPSSAFLGPRWWHFDISGWLIRAFAALGLAWDVKAPPPEVLQPPLELAPRDNPGAAPP